MSESRHPTVPAGTYIAKPRDWQFREIGANKSPCLEVRLEFQCDQKTRVLTWQGFLTEKTKKNTIKSLVTMGFRDRDLTRFVEGAKGKALDANQEVSIVVEHEVKEGKTYTRVKWINAVSGAGFKNALDQEEAKAKASVLDLAGDILAAQEELGVKDEPKFDPSDDIGF